MLQKKQKTFCFLSTTVIKVINRTYSFCQMKVDILTSKYFSVKTYRQQSESRTYATPEVKLSILFVNDSH